MTPTKPGYYWLRWFYVHLVSGEKVCGGTEIVRVFAHQHKPEVLFYRTFIGGTTRLDQASPLHEWSGPIECPFPQ